MQSIRAEIGRWLRDSKKINGGGTLAKGVTRVVGTWADGVGAGIVGVECLIESCPNGFCIGTQMSPPRGKKTKAIYVLIPSEHEPCPLKPCPSLIIKQILSFLISFKKTPKVRFCTKIYILLQSNIIYISIITFLAIP